jgi:putative transcriptional regulator
MDSLRGKLLLAGPTLLDPNFRRTVVLIVEHTEEGAMGLVLNRPSTATVGDAVPDLDWLTESGERVYVGGPVAPNGVIVLAEWNDPDQAAVLVDDDLGFVPGEAPDPDQLLNAVRRARVFAGHAGWGPGQLEDELGEDSWIVVAALADDVFGEDPDELWRRVLQRAGGEQVLMATLPMDPSLN